MSNINDNTVNDSQKPISKGFRRKSEQRVQIPKDAEWIRFKQELNELEKLLSKATEFPAQTTRIDTVVLKYKLWKIFRLKPPKKHEKRIAEQLCADFLGVNRAQFSLFVKRLINKANQFSLGGLGNE